MDLGSKYIVNQLLKNEGQRRVGFAQIQDSNQRYLFCEVTANGSNDKELEAFQREYDLYRTLTGQGMIATLDFKTSETGSVVAFSQSDGILLSQSIQKQAFSIPEFLALAIQLTDILSGLHQQGIEHRHFSPANFIYQPGRQKVLLFDCQFARKNGASPLKEIPLNHLNYLNYISPEQTGRTNQSVDFRTDIYTLGITFYQLLTQQLPFQTEDLAALVHAHIAKTPIAPSTIIPTIPPILSKLVLKMMDKSPALRYQSTIGLKKDLLRCQAAILDNELNPDFVLGLTDISDLFKIPAKLYGRANETRALTEAWQKAKYGAANLMMVVGFSGIGKSALIQQLATTVANSKGFFVQGKFDQFNRDTPYAAGIEAFRQLIRQILSKSDEQITYWQQRFNTALGVNVGIIVEVIPELELITGPPADLIALPPAESLNRFNLAFLQFFQAIADIKHPLVLFLDDLQWVDIPSLKLMELVLADKATNSLLLLGAYRNNEVGETHPLNQTLLSLQQQQIPVEEIKLEQLKFKDLNQLIADTLKTRPTRTNDLSELILKKTGGNPFFTTAFLKSLHQENSIQFNYEKAQWDWDIQQIKTQNITENVVDLMTKKIRFLDEQTQRLLQLAACIGNRFDLSTLATVFEQSTADTMIALAPAIAEELILINQEEFIPISPPNNIELLDDVNIPYQFLHDKVQQAAYALMGEEARQQAHLQIARLLRADFSEAEQQERIFDFVGQFNAGMAAITSPEEKLYVAKLNLVAGKKAKLSAAFDPAFRYLEQGIHLLPPDAWEKHYDVALDLYSEGAEAAYLSNNFAQMENLTQVVFQKSQKDLDQIKAYNITIQAYVSITQNEKALKNSLRALKMLGVTFPKKPKQIHIIGDLLKTKFKLGGKTTEKLLNLPLMTDARMSAVMEILSYAMSPSYFADPNLFPLLVFKQIHLSIKYGNHLHTGFAYSTYALILCGSTNEFDKGQEYGDLAQQLMERFDAKVLAAKIPYIRTHFIRHWKEPYVDTFEESIYGMHQGFDIGDFLFGAYAIFHQITTTLYMGKRLSEAKQLMDSYTAPLAKTQQDLVTNWLNVYRQTVNNLMDKDQVSGVLKGRAMDEHILQPLLVKGSDNSGLGIFYLEKLMLNYLLGFNEKALGYAEKAEACLPHLLATPHPPIIVFYQALSLAKTADGSLTNTQRKTVLKKIGQLLKIIKIWAKSCPENQAHRCALVTAEWYRIKEKKEEARVEYFKAIELAKEQGYLQVTGISYELLANFYETQNNPALSKKYLVEARQTFLEWEAYAKVRQMNERYPVIASLKEAKSTILLGEFPDNRHQNLDMLSLTKASLAIAGEIQLEQLTDKLMEVVTENAGAQQGALIIRKEKEWIVAAETVLEKQPNKKVKDIPVKSHSSIPESIVQYVIRTKDHLVINDVQQDDRFSGNHLVITRKIRSVSCLPILHQSNLIGILYLENNLQPAVFTEKRIQFLTLLSGQIAVSLDNALLYQNLEQKVKERTLEIQQEKEKSDQLLLNILPAETAKELKINGKAQPRSFAKVTVMFTDFVNFSKICETLTANELVKSINHYYSFFDSLMEKYNLEKIKTIGDSYMCVGGLPEVNLTHASDMIKAAMEIQEFVAAQQKISTMAAAKTTFECRIGIHSGPVIAGIVGTKKFAYDIWGETVNIAARLESNGEPGKINISKATYQLLGDAFNCQYRGKIAIKNAGEIDMYFVQ